MGQAVVDLPDPLEKPPTSATSADDLLSQLAGDEIDRLLTEAEVEATPIAPDTALGPVMVGSEPNGQPADALASPAGSESATTTDVSRSAAAPKSTNAPQAATVDAAQPGNAPEAETTVAGVAKSGEPSAAANTKSTINAPVDEFTRQNPAGDAATAGEPVASADAASPALAAADLDAVLSNSVAGVMPAAVEAIAKPSSADLDQAVAADADRILAPHTAALRADAADLAAATVDADERQELLATVAAEATEEPDEVRPLPIWLRPLEWLSAPMDLLSDTVRENLGKVALLTLVNSAAIIVYVRMFRRH